MIMLSMVETTKEQWIISLEGHGAFDIALIDIKGNINITTLIQLKEYGSRSSQGGDEKYSQDSRWLEDNTTQC